MDTYTETNSLSRKTFVRTRNYNRSQSSVFRGIRLVTRSKTPSAWLEIRSPLGSNNTMIQDKNTYAVVYHL